MKILLDAKDLIKLVEHSKPMSSSDFGVWLRNNDSQLIYSLENIRALAGPLGTDPTQLPRILTYLDRLEELPHCFIAANIESMELQSAVRSFAKNVEYKSIDPYVPRFDYVFPPITRPSRSTYTLAEVVADLWAVCPKIFGPRPNLHRILAHAMKEDRSRIQEQGNATFDFPMESTLETLVDKMSVSRQQAIELTNWIAVRSSRCPSLWLARAVGSVMSRDRRYSSRPGDVFDMADAMSLPYVDLATLDRTMLHYFRLAVQLLKKKEMAVEYATDQVFRSLSELLERRSETPRATGP